jgi:hypothetical protein
MAFFGRPGRFFYTGGHFQRRVDCSDSALGRLDGADHRLPPIRGRLGIALWLGRIPFDLGLLGEKAVEQFDGFLPRLG